MKYSFWTIYYWKKVVKHVLKFEKRAISILSIYFLFYDGQTAEEHASCNDKCLLRWNFLPFLSRSASKHTRKTSFIETNSDQGYKITSNSYTDKIREKSRKTWKWNLLQNLISVHSTEESVEVCPYLLNLNFKIVRHC